MHEDLDKQPKLLLEDLTCVIDLCLIIIFAIAVHFVRRGNIAVSTLAHGLSFVYLTATVGHYLEKHFIGLEGVEALLKPYGVRRGADTWKAMIVGLLALAALGVRFWHCAVNDVDCMLGEMEPIHYICKVRRLQHYAPVFGGSAVFLFLSISIRLNAVLGGSVLLPSQGGYAKKVSTCPTLMSAICVASCFSVWLYSTLMEAQVLHQRSYGCLQKMITPGEPWALKLGTQRNQRQWNQDTSAMPASIKNPRSKQQQPLYRRTSQKQWKQRDCETEEESPPRRMKIRFPNRGLDASSALNLRSEAGKEVTADAGGSTSKSDDDNGNVDNFASLGLGIPDVKSSIYSLESSNQQEGDIPLWLNNTHINSRNQGVEQDLLRVRSTPSVLSPPSRGMKAAGIQPDPISPLQISPPNQQHWLAQIPRHRNTPEGSYLNNDSCDIGGETREEDSGWWGVSRERRRVPVAGRRVMSDQGLGSVPCCNDSEKYFLWSSMGCHRSTSTSNSESGRESDTGSDSSDDKEGMGFLTRMPTSRVALLDQDNIQLRSDMLVMPDGSTQGEAGGGGHHCSAAASMWTTNRMRFPLGSNEVSNNFRRGSGGAWSNIMSQGKNTDRRRKLNLHKTGWCPPLQWSGWVGGVGDEDSEESTLEGKVLESNAKPDEIWTDEVVGSGILDEVSRPEEVGGQRQYAPANEFRRRGCRQVTGHRLMFQEQILTPRRFLGNQERVKGE